MNKKGLIGMIILISILIIGIVAAGTGYYFYKVKVYKTLRVCLGEYTDTDIPCDDVQYCLDTYREIFDFESELEGAPDFLASKVGEIKDSALKCEETCMVRNIRGANLEDGNFEMLDSCGVTEIEVAIDIHGDEGLELGKWMKNKETE